MATNNAINLNLAAPTCAFAAYSVADQLNVTGDATMYQILFPDEIFDNTNSFAGSTFVAPVDGKYAFGMSICLGGLDINDTVCALSLYSTSGMNNYNYNILFCKFSSSQFPLTGGYVYNSNIQLTMLAGDTLIAQLKITGSTKTVDILGSATTGFRTPYFYGYLLSEV